MAEVKAIIIALIIFSGVIIGISNFYGDLANTYGANQSNIAVLNKTAQMNKLMKDVYNAANATPGQQDALAFIPPQYRNAISLTFGSVDIFSDVVTGVTNNRTGSQNPPVPSWISDMAIAMVSITVILGIIAAILKWNF